MLPLSGQFEEKLVLDKKFHMLFRYTSGKVRMVEFRNEIWSKVIHLKVINIQLVYKAISLYEESKGVNKSKREIWSWNPKAH